MKRRGSVEFGWLFFIVLSIVTLPNKLKRMKKKE